MFSVPFYARPSHAKEIVPLNKKIPKQYEDFLVISFHAELVGREL